MKKTLGTIIAAIAVVLGTGTFALAEYAGGRGSGNFPSSTGLLDCGGDGDYQPKT